MLYIREGNLDAHIIRVGIRPRVSRESGRNLWFARMSSIHQSRCLRFKAAEVYHGAIGRAEMVIDEQAGAMSRKTQKRKQG